MTDKRVRVRSVATDTSSPFEPRLKYVYSEGRTRNKRDDERISVIWDTGGLSAVRNDDNVTWLDDAFTSEETTDDR